MEYSIKKENLKAWCSIPYTELADNPDKKFDRIELYQTKKETFEHIGNMMAEEVIANNKKGEYTKWILPAGPLDQYETFTKRVNEEGISLKKLVVFHMDEWLNWESRPYPVRYAFNSLRGIMEHDFYGKIDKKLNVPESQRIWPDVTNLDYFDDKVAEWGGIDTVWAGIGYKGLIAFDESPIDPYSRITIDEYAASRTRIVKINPDTIIALSEREAGGCYDAIPPMAITLGFKSILTSKRIVFMITTGAWKNTVIRVLLFSEPTLEYPVTILVDRIKEKVLCCDVNTLRHPFENDNGYYSKGLE